MSGRRCKNLLTSYMKYTDKTESPDTYHLWSCLSMIAACVRRKVWVDMGYFQIYPNMYIVLIGPPGCKKSTAINIATRLCNKLEDVRISADSITREALIKAIRESEIVEQGVFENANTMYTHSSLTVVSKELSVFLGSGNHDLLALLTDLYDCHPKWEYRTKNSGIDTITNQWLNMLAASTPAWLVGSIPITAIGGGYTSRVVFVVEYSPKCPIPRPRLSPEEKALEEDIIHDLEKISLCRGEFQLSKEAEDCFDTWYMKHYASKVTDPRFTGYMERKPMHLLKTSILIALACDSPNIITPDHLITARTLLDNLEKNMMDAFGAAGRSKLAPDVGEILQAIKDAGKNGVTKKELMKGVWRDITPADFSEAVRSLFDMGMVEEKIINGQITYTWKEQ